MKLADFTQGRDNNFNFIRMVAACAVLVSHSFALTMGTEKAEPLRDILGMTLGTIAVDIFFIISGFLVTASLLSRQSTIDFIWARVLRIFPALLIMLMITVFGLGLIFSTLPWLSYLSNAKTYIYLVKCLTLFTGISTDLPGVFESNPYKNIVNGSLWTMPLEIRMYAILAFLWIILRLTPSIRVQAFRAALLSCALLAGLLVILGYFNIIKYSHFLRLFFMFFAGAAFYAFKNRIIVSHPIFFSFAILLTASTLNKQTFFAFYIFLLPYLLFYLAYIPSGLIRNYNNVGDYSYGIYIYAFPVQQSVVAISPGISVTSLILISSVITFIFAVLSWHLLEHHALKLKGIYVNHTRELLSNRAFWNLTYAKLSGYTKLCELIFGMRNTK